MSNRRKHLHNDRRHLNGIEWPRENCHLAKAQGSKGDNLIAVEHTDGSSTLVLLPAKFRKKLWIRKGNFLIIEQIHQEEAKGKQRITGSIQAVLTQEHIKDLIDRCLWPAEFMAKEEAPQRSLHVDQISEESNSDDDMSELQPNMNRPRIMYEVSEDEE